MMKPFVVRIPEAEKRFLYYKAAASGKSVGEIIRTALQEYMNNDKNMNPASSLLDWATRNKGKNIKTDLSSTNYKKYLYGK